jgi:aspartyl protease family protein
VRTLTWILLAVLAIALLAAAAQHNPDLWRDFIPTNFDGIENKTMALVLAGILALALFNRHFSNALKSAIIWALIALVLVVGYAYRFELRDVTQRILAELMPGRPATLGRTVEIARSAGGSFSVSASVNGARIAMVLDTGASAVVLTQEAAKAAGLPLEVLNYSISVETANGRTRAAPVTLDRVSIGGITERSVPALIAQPGQLRSNLLGMSFLNRLESWEVRGDRLLMRGYP